MDQGECLKNQLALARREIKNLRQQLKTLVIKQKKEFDGIKDTLKNWRCQNCKENVSVQNSKDETSTNYRPIATIHTNFPEKRGTPRQPSVCSDATAKLTLNKAVFTNPHHALEGLEQYSHLWIIFCFHKNKFQHEKAKVSPPRLHGAKVGVFATRSPHRPNSIGLSLVEITQVVGDVIFFNGVDMVDNTPVYDIKPYIPFYDNPEKFQIVQPVTSIKSEELSKLDEVDGNSLELDVTSTDEQPFLRSTSTTAKDTILCSENASTLENFMIKIPSWIEHPAAFEVTFADSASTYLQQIITNATEMKNTITNVLREDPRSVYLRKKWSGERYVFRIENVIVSCLFNDINHSVHVCEISKDSDTEYRG